MARLQDFDWDAHRTTFARWWAHDLGRPLVMATTWNRFTPTGYASQPPLCQGHLGAVPLSVPAEAIAEDAAHHVAAADYHGDAFPKFWMNFGPGVLAAFLGGDLHADTRTTWFTPGIHAGKAIGEVEIPTRLAGVWWDRVQAVTRACAARFGTRAVVGLTDIGGNLDVVASLRDTSQALLDCMDDPADITRLCQAVTRRWWECYEQQCAIIEPLGLGTSPWAPIWSAERCYMLQSDFSYMISPKQFARWVVPDLADICARIPHGFYHLDGKGELPHLDHLLAVPGLKGVQWIPGDGQPTATDPAWRDVLRRIRAAGKLVQIFSPASACLKLASEMPLDGFLIATWSDIPGMDHGQAVQTILAQAEKTRQGQRCAVAVA